MYIMNKEKYEGMQNTVRRNYLCGLPLPVTMAVMS